MPTRVGRFHAIIFKLFEILIARPRSDREKRKARQAELGHGPVEARRHARAAATALDARHSCGSAGAAAGDTIFGRVKRTKDTHPWRCSCAEAPQPEESRHSRSCASHATGHLRLMQGWCLASTQSDGFAGIRRPKSILPRLSARARAASNIWNMDVAYGATRSNTRRG